MNFTNELKAWIKDLETRDTEYYRSLSSWFGNILISACGFLGVLIALPDNAEAALHIRLAYVLSILLGILGVLLLTVALFYETLRAKRIRKETYRLFRQGTHVYSQKNENIVSVDFCASTKPPTFLLWIGVIACIVLFLFFISTVFYVVAKNFPEIGMFL
ncbi:hypothetical protein [Parabacteroides timonensis]|uniref:hypothetical protein n=1 Tax=Parabacteroides timonensis TaxID=1871013 RepID=UPI00111545C2|nr:hypothetical protein [Parabacteroides timonensis]